MNYDVVVVGAGDLGIRVARSLSKTYSVLAVRRSELRGFPFDTLQLDVGNQSSSPNYSCKVMLYCLSAGGRTLDNYQNAYVKGFKNALTLFQPEQTLFVSSTRVYGQCGDEWLDESVNPKPSDEFGEILLEAEHQAFQTGSALRLSGIYGPGREWLIRKARDGFGTDKPHWTNRIHVEDAADIASDLIQCQLKGDNISEVVLATDGHSVQMSEVLDWLRAQVDANRTQNMELPGPGKRLRSRWITDNQYELKYPEYKSGYAAILKDV